MKFSDRQIRNNNVVEIGGRILRVSPPQEWGGYATLQCEYSVKRISYPGIRVVGNVAGELLWLPYQTPVLVRAHVQDYTVVTEKGSTLKKWRLEADRVLADNTTNLDEEAPFDQNMVSLVGEVRKIGKLPGARLKVVLLCREKNHEPCIAEVEMFKNTLEGLDEGMNIGLLAYLDMTSRKNPKTKKWFPSNHIKVVHAWIVEESARGQR